MAPVPELVFENAVLSGALFGVLVLVGLVQQRLGPEADWIEGVRNRWWYRLNEVQSVLGMGLTTRKTPREYIVSTDATPEALEPILYEAGWHRNLASFEKYRTGPDGTEEKTVSTWAYRERLFGPKQDHIYIFPGHGPFGADVYGHTETNWLHDPAGHLEDHQADRGPADRLRTLLSDADVGMERDEAWADGEGD